MRPRLSRASGWLGRRLGRSPQRSAPPAGEAPDAAAGEHASEDPLAEAIAVLGNTPLLDLQARGYHFHRRDYYSPDNDLDFLARNKDLWQGRPLPAGIAWNLQGQLELLREIAPYVKELHDVPSDPPARAPLAQYHWNNDFWRGTDAFVHYALLRHLKPRRLVEIGCGWSSLLMARALARNEAEGTPSASVHQIEPYPRRELMEALPDHWTVEETILQRASLAAVERLRANDVLFYDGSHVAKVASDVNWFMFELLPRVSPGVLVHVHDVFWPGDYPEPWIFERGQTWNEQYVLQAFLMFNSEFEVLMANAALVAEHAAEVQTLLTIAPEPISIGGSVWLRRRGS
jgi:predicted O-methyltransferase YrrM